MIWTGSWRCGRSHPRDIERVHQSLESTSTVSHPWTLQLAWPSKTFKTGMSLCSLLPVGLIMSVSRKYQLYVTAGFLGTFSLPGVLHVAHNANSVTFLRVFCDASAGGVMHMAAEIHRDNCSILCLSLCGVAASSSDVVELCLLGIVFASARNVGLTRHQVNHIMLIAQTVARRP